MKLLIIVGIVLILITILFLMLLASKNKFNDLDIKIEEATSNIDLYLLKKETTLSNIIKIVIEQGEDENKFDDFNESIEKDNTSFELHSILNKYYSSLSKLLLDKDDLSKNDDIIKHLISLKNNEEDLIGSIKFYNDTVVDYNGLTKTFPHKLYAKIKSLDNKEFYNNEKEELFDILK